MEQSGLSLEASPLDASVDDAEDALAMEDVMAAASAAAASASAYVQGLMSKDIADAATGQAIEVIVAECCQAAGETKDQLTRGQTLS